MSDIGFYEAREMWVPTLNDILFKAENGTADERAYYSQFGLGQVEIPTEATHVSAIMPRAVEMFNERFGQRMINRETLETWQIGIQSTFDTIVFRFDHALAIYAENTEKMNNVLERKKTTRFATSQDSGTDSTTYGRTDTFSGASKSIDTPDSAINATDDYADSVTKNDNTNTASGTDTLTHGLLNTLDDSVTETHEPAGGIVDAINRNIDTFRDITADFVREFENNFLNVFWY